jgi:hypothetical protein
MNLNILLPIGKKILEFFWNSKEVKQFVVHLLEKYSKSTDNDVDDMAVELIRKKLLV